jgi:hypothetical protein
MSSTSDPKCAVSTDAIQRMGCGATGEAGREEGGGPEPEALRAGDQLADRSPERGRRGPIRSAISRFETRIHAANPPAPYANAPVSTA